MKLDLIDLIHRHRIFLGILVLVLGLVAVSLFVFRWHLGVAFDLMNLMAITRSMSELVFPSMGGSHLMPSQDYHQGPLLLLIGLLWRVVGPTNENLLTLFSFTGIFGAGLFLCSLYRLLLILFGEPKKAGIVILGPIFFLGPVHTFWTGDYSIVGLMYTSMLPQVFSYSVAFTCLVIFFKYQVRPKNSYLIGLVFLTALLIILHFLTFTFLLLGILCFSFGRRHSFDDVKVAIAIVAGSVLAWFWPYFSWSQELLLSIWPREHRPVFIIAGFVFLLLIFFSTRVVWGRKDALTRILDRYRVVLLSSLLYTGWLVSIVLREGISFHTWPLDKRILGTAGLGAILGLRRIHPFKFYLLCWSGSCFLVYAGGLLAVEFGFSLPLWHRFSFFAMLPSHLLFGAFLFQEITRPRSIRVPLICLFVVLAIGLNIFAVGELARQESFVSPDTDYVSDLVGRESIIISDDYTSRILAGYYGLTTVHPILSEQRALERRMDVQTFFNSTKPDDQLFGIRDKYGADVAVLYLDDQSMKDLGQDLDLVRERFDELFPIIGENDLFVIYDIR